MGFSATGNLLSGSVQQPDTVMFITSKVDRSPDSLVAWSTSRSIESTNAKINLLGYIPVVSTITGLGRALLGVIHTIEHLAGAIFSDHREHHLQETLLGAKNIVRGLVEAVPVIGNITMFVVDILRVNKYEKMAKEKIEKNKAAYNNHISMFIYGQEIAKRPIAEVMAEMEKLNRKPSLVDLEKVIRNVS